MSFFTSSTGEKITGEANKAHLQDFTVIPNGTTALAAIKEFSLVNRTNNRTGDEESYYEIKWLLTNTEFKGREVSQKIKTFSGTPEQIDRHKHMLKRVFDIGGYDHVTAAAPQTSDISFLRGRVMGIQIREYQIANDKGGFITGNFVGEVHPNNDLFKSELGIKMAEPKPKQKSAVETAFSRNQAIEKDFDSDIPF